MLAQAPGATIKFFLLCRVCCASSLSHELLESVYNSFIAPFHRLTETHFTFPFLIRDEICHTRGEENALASDAGDGVEL
jgi:hypothetical protein